MATLAPAEARARASSLPIFREPPVTTAFFPSRLKESGMVSGILFHSSG
jgi:hypothetical protein